jgi:hypothetical protein
MKRRTKSGREVTATQLFATREAMRKAGWVHTLSVNEVNAGTNFGSLWEKDGQKFWLNFRTIESLPID